MDRLTEFFKDFMMILFFLFDENRDFIFKFWLLLFYKYGGVNMSVFYAKKKSS